MTTARRTPPTRRRRYPLSRERIVAKALEIVDADSLSALTMRRLAKELDVEPMSLYHHVADRDALLDGIGGLVIQQVPSFDDLVGPWDDAVREAALRFRSTLVAHPHVVHVIASRPASIEYLADLATSTLELFERVGLAPDVAEDLLWLLNAYIMGNVINQVGTARTLDAREASFRRGLDRILAGFAATMDAVDAGPRRDPDDGRRADG